MKLRLTCIAAAVGAILLGSASCVKINEELGGNFIPTKHKWDVFPCDAVALDVTMERSDSLSGYSSSRFTFGSVKSGDFTSTKSCSFTLVPLADSLDFGEDHQVLQFHFTASRDTVSVPFDSQKEILQSMYAYDLKKPLDSTVLYTGVFPEQADEFVDFSSIIAFCTYNGGDSLSFDFSKSYAEKVIEGIKSFQQMEADRRDTLNNLLAHVPGIYMKTEQQTTDGGRINMFNLPIDASDGYIDGNYAELKIRSKFDGSSEYTDTSYIFYFGPSEFLTDKSTSYPPQYAFNAGIDTTPEDFLENWKNGARTELFVEGGSGLKPVVRASVIKEIVSALIEEHAEGINKEEVVINKATIILPYNVGTDYEKLEKYPLILSPTVKLRSDNDKYVSYAGLTDSSIESENHGNINRSLFMYRPDVSHHIQEIVKLEKGKGTDVDPNETDADFEKRLSKYDIWFLIMHEEITKSSSSNSAYNDYYNNLLYNSYYNNMMYDPYGYGYGYGGYGGYGYGGYGYGSYGYNNYYNYLMMAQYASASTSQSTTSSTELDKDRFYNAVLCGPGAGDGNVPRLEITFSAPKKSE